MSRQQYNIKDLKDKFTRVNLFPVYNVGNLLQSIWENAKKCSGFSVEEKNLNEVFKDLHWLYRLGLDVYRKPIESLGKEETLWVLGIIMHICKEISLIEGPVQPVAGTLQTDYYQMAVWLRSHHDSLQTKRNLSINSSSFSEERPLFYSDTDSYIDISSHISSSSQNRLLPDPIWWNYSDPYYQQRSHDLFSFIFNTSSSNDGYILGQTIRFQIETVKLGARLVSEGIHQLGGLEEKIADVAPYVSQGYDFAEHTINTSITEIHRGLDSASTCFQQGCCGIYDCCNGIGSNLSECVSSAGDFLSNCGSGIGEILSNCLGCLCHFQNVCCCCGELNCNGGGGGDCSGLGVICTGICGAGVWCSNLCCGCIDTDSAHGDNGPHLLVDHHGLIKSGAGHLSIPLTNYFSNTVGSWLTGAYSLAFGPPAAYIVLQALWKFIRGGERQHTRSRDRLAALADLLSSTSLGSGLFFGGLYIPFGGAHTALSFGIFGAIAGKKIAHKYRQRRAAQTYGNFPSAKVEKYAMNREQLADLYCKLNQYQPGSDVGEQKKSFRTLLEKIPQEFKNSSYGFGKSPIEFFDAQETLEKVALYVRHAHVIAKTEKTQALNSQGVCGLYCSLYNGSYRSSDRRKNALTAIKEAREAKDPASLVTLS